MRTKYHKGFTLVEIITAIAVLVVGVVGVAQVFPVGLRASKLAGDITIATLVAQKKIEEIKADGYEDISDHLNGSVPNSIDTAVEGDFSYGDDVFSAFSGTVKGFLVEDSDKPGNPIDGLYRIDVEIKWLDRGSERKEVFKTYIGDLG